MDQNNRDVQESKCFSVQSDYGEVENQKTGLCTQAFLIKLPTCYHVI